MNENMFLSLAVTFSLALSERRTAEYDGKRELELSLPCDEFGQTRSCEGL